MPGNERTTLSADAVVSAAGPVESVAARLAGGAASSCSKPGRASDAGLFRRRGRDDRPAHTISQTTSRSLPPVPASAARPSSTMHCAGEPRPRCWPSGARRTASTLTDAAFAPFVDGHGARSARPQQHASMIETPGCCSAAPGDGWSGESMPRSGEVAPTSICATSAVRRVRSSRRCYVHRAPSAPEHASSRMPASIASNSRTVRCGPCTRRASTHSPDARREPARRYRSSPLPAACQLPALLRSGLASGSVRAFNFWPIHVTGRFDSRSSASGPTMAYAVTSGRAWTYRSGLHARNTAVHPIATASALPGFGSAHNRMADLPHLARARRAARSRAAVSRYDAGAVRVNHALNDRRRLAQGWSPSRAFLAAGSSGDPSVEGSAGVRGDAISRRGMASSGPPARVCCTRCISSAAPAPGGETRPAACGLTVGFAAREDCS